MRSTQSTIALERGRPIRAGRVAGRPDSSGSRTALGAAILLVAALLLMVGSSGSVAAATIDFDDLAPGTSVSTIGDTTFAHSDAGASLVVASGRITSSAPAYLGAEAGSGPTGDSQNLMLPGESLSLGFATPTYALELKVISTAGTPPDAFELVTPSGSVSSGATPFIDASGDEFWQLSVVVPQPFSSAELRSTTADEVFAFHVDDVVVPEPKGGSVLGAGLAGLIGLASRSARRSGLAGSASSDARIIPRAGDS